MDDSTSESGLTGVSAITPPPPASGACNPPSTNWVIARNVLWNWAGMATHMLSGFVVAPFLIRELGDAGYGLWILIASLTGYCDLLDLGLRASLGRNIALYRAQQDGAGVNTVVQTGLVLLFIGAGAVLLVTGGAIPLYYHLFAIPAPFREEVWLALLLIGLNLALVFVLWIFDAILWGHERFDLLNSIDIPIIILRTVLTLTLVDVQFHPLLTLSLIVLSMTLLSGLGKASCALRIAPSVHWGVGHFNRATAVSLMNFGVWVFLLSISQILTAQLGPFLIGSFLGVGLVTPFSVAARLVEYVRSLLVASTGVLTPLATTLHVQQQRTEQEMLFIWGGRFSLSLSLYCTGLCVFLGGAFIRLWVGRELTFAPELLTILILGHLLALSQLATFSMVLGMDRHRPWAVMELLGTALMVVLASILLPQYGVLGMGLACAIPLVVCRGLAPLLYACWLLRISPGEYFLRSLLPPLLGAALPIVGLAALTSWRLPTTWLGLIGYGALYSLLFVVTGMLIIIGPSRLTRLHAQWRGRSAPTLTAQTVP